MPNWKFNLNEMYNITFYTIIFVQIPFIGAFLPINHIFYLHFLSLVWIVTSEILA